MTSNLDEQFNLRKSHRTGKYFLLLNQLQSLVARWSLECSLDVSYGESRGQRVDIFPAEGDASGVFVFIHGGYFRALDKAQYRYIARRMVPEGYTTVLVNYDLAPRVSVAEIVRQVSRSFSWLCRNLHRWNGDPRRIVLCGHSVGAFLVAKLLEQEGAPAASDACRVRKVVLLSGLYDLGPMRQSYLNQTLGLTSSDVETLSPISCALKQSPEILVAVGEEETAEFIRQSEEYSKKLRNDGVANDLLVMPGIHHYTMSRLLARSDNPLMRWILDP